VRKRTFGGDLADNQHVVIRLFLLFEAATFVTASLIHNGVPIRGDEHAAAAQAESIIAGVLLAGLATSWVRPHWTRPAGLIAQGFALLGTLVGITTILAGVGPRTVPDLVYHIGIVIVLAWGLVVTWRSKFGRSAS
jgi:hypothetical protein